MLDLDNSAYGTSVPNACLLDRLMMGFLWNTFRNLFFPLSTLTGMAVGKLVLYELT